jgi:MFS transporter, DHA1 family, inner membrane transport protein
MSPAVQSAGAERAGLTAVVILAIGTFATGTDAFIVAGVLPSIARSLDSSLALAGQLVTIYALAYALGSPLITTATANWPRRSVLVGSLLLFALVNVFSAISQSMAMLAATRVPAAVLAGLVAPTAASSATALVAESMRGRVLAIVLGGTALSTVFGVPIGLYLAELIGWRGAFLFVSTLALVAAVGVAIRLPAIETPPRLDLRERAALLRRLDILIVLLITVCANAGGFSVYTYIAPLFGDLGGEVTLQTLILTFGVAAVLGGYLSGHGSDRWGAAPVLTLVLAVFTLNHFLLALAAGTFATSLLYMAIWGMVGFGTVPPQQHRLVQSAGPAAGIALSLNSSAIYLGIGLGGLLGGYVVQTAGADHLWLIAGACGTLALVLQPISRAAERRAAIAPGRVETT